MRGLYSREREYRKIFLRSHFLHISQILEGNYFGAYTCRACIRTRANTGKYSWGIIYVLVSCQGVVSCELYEENPRRSSANPLLTKNNYSQTKMMSFSKKSKFPGLSLICYLRTECTPRTEIHST